jgi:hypothetical protein
LPIVCFTLFLSEDGPDAMQCSIVPVTQITSQPPGVWQVTLWTTYLQMGSCRGVFDLFDHHNSFMNLFCRDFNAPLHPPRPADSSAATIAATGLLLLANMEKSLTPSNTTGYKLWTKHAIKVRHRSLTAGEASPIVLPFARSWPIQPSLLGSLIGKVCCRMGQ